MWGFTMKYEVIETKVFIVESVDESSARMAVDTLQDEMQLTERSFEAAKGGNCSAYGKVITMAETTNVFVA